MCQYTSQEEHAEPVFHTPGVNLEAKQQKQQKTLKQHQQQFYNLKSP